MDILKSLLFSACAALCLFTGCSKQQQFKAVEDIRLSSVEAQICLPDTTKAEAMQIAEEVLGKMHFTIEKADAEQGIIRTRPLPGAQFFEFWRSDNIGAFNSAEANLHSIRRIVELDISGVPKQQGELLCISCNVKTQRLSLPERQISSSWRAYEMFSQSSPSLQKLELNPEQKRGMAWVDLGKDAKLSTEILKRIENKIGDRD